MGEHMNIFKKNQYCLFCNEVLRKVWFWQPKYKFHENCLHEGVLTIVWEDVFDEETGEKYLKLYAIEKGGK